MRTKVARESSAFLGNGV